MIVMIASDECIALDITLQIMIECLECVMMLTWLLLNACVDMSV